MIEYHYCPECGKVVEVELVKTTPSALIFKCKKGHEIVDLGPYPL